MADQCYAVAEQGYLDEFLRTHRVVAVADTGQLADALRPHPHARAAATGTLADRASYTIVGYVAEHGRFSDALQLVAHGRVQVRERARFADRARPHRRVALEASAQCTDAARGHRSQRVVEHGVFDEAWAPLRHPSAKATARGRLRDAVRPARVVRVAASGHVVDLARVGRHARLAESMPFLEEWHVLRNVAARLAESARLADALHLKAHARTRVADEAFFAERWRLPDAGAAWTANTDTWAMSRYTGLAVNSLAVVDGAVMAAGDGGLYRLDADSDAGAPIDAWIETGKSDGGSDAMKRAPALYAGGTGGALEARVNGQYTYAFEDRWDADEPRTTRCKIGRGLTARYFQFRIGNVDGGEMTLESLAVEFITLPRRLR